MFKMKCTNSTVNKKEDDKLETNLQARFLEIS